MVSIATVCVPPLEISSQKPSILKRKQSDTNLSPDSSQAKRPRVSFDPVTEEHIVPDFKEKGLDLVTEEVKRALARHAANDSTGYGQIRQLFLAKPSEDDAPSSTLLRNYVFVLGTQCAQLDNRYASLVSAVAHCRWALRDDAFVAAFQKFLQWLVPAHVGHVKSVYEELVDNFVNPPRTYARHIDDPPVTRQQIWTRTHQCINDVVSTAPASIGMLKNVLTHKFPHIDDPTRLQANYITNLFKLAGQHRSISGAIQTLIMQQIIKIDNQIEEDLDEAEDETALTDEIFDNEMNVEESESEDESDAESVASLEDDASRLKKLRELTKKLDTLMDLVFEHFHDIFLHGSPHAINDTFEFLLLHFSNHILPSYRTRHIQFLLFHYAQTSPTLAERFIARCAEITIDTQRLRPLMIRSAASAYLASFIARGAHVGPQLVRAVVSLLLDRLESLRQRQAPGCTGPDVHRYGPYYAQAQALLYIFCFRWRDLVDLPSSEGAGADFADAEDALAAGADLRWFSNLQPVLTANLHCALNPLKVCSPVLVEQFARVAHHTQFAYVYTILAQNKRVRLGRNVGRVVGAGGARMSSMHERETALSGRGEEGLQLEAHFPFDPLRLPRCRRWVEGDYVEWRGVRGMDDGGSGSEEESEEEEEDSEDGESGDEEEEE